MDLITILLIALGVSADAFAVAVGHGAASRRLPRIEPLRVAMAFGVFQAAMTAIGWLVGNRFQVLIMAYDHWVAFALLAGIGGKMIRDDLSHDDGGQADEGAIRSWHLLTLAVATSIDALAVGLGLSFLPSISVTAAAIGVVTFAFSFGGVVLGHRFKSLAHRHAKTVGGVILIAIGTKILLDHLGLL